MPDSNNPTISIVWVSLSHSVYRKRGAAMVGTIAMGGAYRIDIWTLIGEKSVPVRMAQIKPEEKNYLV